MLLPWLALAWLAAPGEPSARPNYYALTDMVDDADFICVGRIEEILSVRSPQAVAGVPFQPRTELPIARIVVELVLEGDPNTDVVYNEAWATSSCYSTQPSVGERALFDASWSRVLAAIDCSDCPSYAEGDRQRLEMLR